VVVAVVQVIGSVGAARWHHASLTPFAVALLLVGPAAIAGLRRWPLAPVAVSIAAAVTYASLDFPIGPIFVAPVAALWLEFIRSRLDRWAAMRREQALARDRQATEERVAIARELHDVIGHSLSLIGRPPSALGGTGPDVSARPRPGVVQARPAAAASTA